MTQYRSKQVARKLRQSHKQWTIYGVEAYWQQNAKTSFLAKLSLTCWGQLFGFSTNAMADAWFRVFRKPYSVCRREQIIQELRRGIILYEGSLMDPKTVNNAVGELADFLDVGYEQVRIYLRRAGVPYVRSAYDVYHSKGKLQKIRGIHVGNNNRQVA